jgi:hypothetical protein
MDYLWTLCLYGLFVYFMFVWTPILCCGLFVNCVFNVSVLWILYGLSFYVVYIVDEFAVIFCIFFKKICSEIVNYRWPPWPPKIINTIFGIC